MTYIFKDLPKDLEKIIKNYKEQLEKTDIEKIAKKFLDNFSSVTIVLSKYPSFKNKIVKEFTDIGYMRIENGDLTLMKGNTTKPPAKDIVGKLKVKEEEKEQLVNDISIALKGFIRTLNKTIKVQKKGQMGGGKKLQKSRVSLKDLPKELEKIVKDYKKQFEMVERLDKIAKNINKKWKELEIAEKRKIKGTQEFSQKLFNIIKKYIKMGGDFKKLDISKQYKKNMFL